MVENHNFNNYLKSVHRYNPLKFRIFKLCFTVFVVVFEDQTFYQSKRVQMVCPVSEVWNSGPNNHRFFSNHYIYQWFSDTKLVSKLEAVGRSLDIKIFGFCIFSDHSFRRNWFSFVNEEDLCLQRKISFT